MILLDVFFIDEAHDKASKVERLQRRAPPSSCSAPIEEETIGVRVQLSSITVDRLSVHQSTNAPASIPATITTTATNTKENPYTKSGVGKCYRCGEPEYRSNEFSKRKNQRGELCKCQRERGRIEELNDQTLSKIRETLSLVLFRDYCATRRHLTLCSDIKSFIQGTRSRTRYAISSLITKAARTSCLEYL